MAAGETLNLVREQQAAWRPAGVKAVVISRDEAWTYLGCRKGKQRQSLGIGTAVVVESDGRWWRDFEVGGRDTETFLRLPEAAKYSTDRTKCIIGCRRTAMWRARGGKAIGTKGCIRSCGGS